MESWRERGFVPDSDAEGELDSQDTKDVIQDVEYGDEIVLVNAVSARPLNETVPASQDEDTNEERPSSLDANEDNDRFSQSSHDVLTTALAQNNDDGDFTPKARGENMEHAAGLQTGSVDEDTMVDERMDNNASQELLAAPESSPPSTPRAAKQRDVWDIPSSSPDELQAGYHPFLRKQVPISPSPREPTDSQRRSEDDGNDDHSPISSPPSSLHSLPLNEADGQVDKDGTDQPPRNKQEDLLSPLEIPEDVLQELAQPSRRSLRQRNPIQLHPYLLEDAKYQTLMKARGIRPVRIAQYQEALRVAKESQGHDFVDNAEPPSSSPTAGIPSAEVSFGPEKSPQRHAQHLSPTRENSPDGIRGPKRRKISRPGDQSRPQHLARPQMIVDNSSSPFHMEENSTHNVPPSPPRSGSPSPQVTQTFKEFKFPRGFIPPALNNHSSLPSQVEKDAGDEAHDMDLSDGGDIADVQSTATQSDYPDERDEDAHEEAVRQLQRRIKGVLPASWLRLDQQKQKHSRLSSTQRNHDKAARLENAKGVARKVTKRNDSATPFSARGQLASLENLADRDSSNESGDDEVGGHINARQALANLVGFDDPFHDEDLGDDILEDNRIDYMFPIATRATSSRSENQEKKRSRPEGNSARINTYSKRSRLKRQTRLTDPIYPSRSEKQPAPAPPRLSLLDAPDVAKPQSRQPQFLRVAARKVRSRRDMGRHSPGRKVFRLSSRLDTEDANASLREWHTGRLRQTKLPKPQVMARTRQPLMDLATNKSDRLDIDQARDTIEYPISDAGFETRSGESGTVETSNTTPTPASGHNDIPPKSAQRDQGNKWIVRRNVAVSSLKRNVPRPVAPEPASTGNYMGSSSLPLNRSLSLFISGNRHKHLPRASLQNPVMQRFLTNHTAPVAYGPLIATAKTSSKLHDELPGTHAQGSRRQRRKRPPKRLDVNMAENQETISFVTPDPEPLDAKSRDIQPRPRDFGGLKGFQSSYTIDFNVSPLFPGTFFHETTFIGSTEFAQSLEISKRDLDKDGGFFSMKVGHQSFRWGPWNDSVSSELGIAFDAIIEDVEKHEAVEATAGHLCRRGSNIYRSLIKYVTETMAFIDPIDRVGFIKRVHVLISKLNDNITPVSSMPPRDLEHVASISSYNLVFANQALQIARNALVDAGIANEALELVRVASHPVILFVSSPAGQANISNFLQACKSREARESGIRDNYSVVEAYVIVQKVLGRTDLLKWYFGDFVAEAYSIPKAGDSDTSKDIEALESRWHRIFNILPLSEIDVFGIAQVGSRFKERHDNWSAIQALLRPVLDVYDRNSVTPISYNNYCRALLHRCFYLINSWGWRDCKPLLDTLYDFFAKNTLYNLKLEENYTSPAFLDELDRNPSLEVKTGDPCFHIFLKIIASGLRYLSKAYDKKRVRNFAWRLLPNHGRVYPKDQSIHQTDLDALRNHHDLLCTLYYSVPDGCRPRLEAIKNLVHPASSHRETCNISLRSWSRLVRFKLSTDEDVSGLEPFADWHCYFVSELLKQHTFARREVEAQNTGGNQFSHNLIERTISQNQRQIESLLKSSLSGLQSAIRSAPTLDHAEKLVSKAPVPAVLGLFNSKLARVNSTVTEALRVIAAYMEKCRSLHTAAAGVVSVTADEDSQEFGDWTDIEALCGAEWSPVRPGIEHVEKVFYPAVSRLVSNCFGEDNCPEDALLLDAIDCWTSIAEVLVKYGIRHWDNYLSPYDSDSWATLRATMQTRKFTPKFLASCIEKDPRFTSECKLQVFALWMSSLVERESILKFQHSLTEALLNQDSTNPVLQNLPFSRDQKDGRFSITPDDFKQRRVSLISSLLSNMRAHLQDLEERRSKDLLTTKQECRELVQNMMSSMKANYRELGSGEASAQGEYVGFVHRVVGFLQQHTRDICLIDPFFTDPTSFPLPSTDPTYIVARLKSYEPKLSSEKVAKTLITFIQGVSERAAIDGQQNYLVEQMHASMADSYEAGDPNKPTLRAILIQAVFPAYLETVFSNPAAWIFCRPIIHTVSLTFEELLFSLDTMDRSCVSSILGIFNVVFRSTYRALSTIIRRLEMLNEPPVALTVASFIRMIRSSLRVVEYVDRITSEGESLVSQVRFFRQFVLLAASHLHNQLQTDDLGGLSLSSNAFAARDGDDTPTTVPKFFQKIRQSAVRELQAYVNESWSRHRGKYYFTRRGGQQPQEVSIGPEVAVQLEQPPATVFDDAALAFFNALETLGLLGDSDQTQIPRNRYMSMDESWPLMIF
ncbi:hypothetical protein EYZ11_004670 [Aspergillus tanneri]|uniref:Mus7/MMS22 family-domain-containing protein n=1 Tax=Aspergillus tanneri TaxID=1220188 RepID=A0A4S3JK53_9EURO|nr:uncharacterized protein ATNIH1004_008393 [Aspergillus tanneri]KAA8644194.1 hypothetical protein ATNIH1004_008393 [Aspergillus tanneri]THC95843.1 hypothetical protein EYZ11_004670 [Aspergillus tanneri]